MRAQVFGLDARCGGAGIDVGGEELFLKARIVAKIDEKSARTEANFVPRAQRRLTQDARAVDVGAIAAAEIDERGLAPLEADQAMVPADFRKVQAQVAVAAAADEELIAGQGDLAHGFGAAARLDEAWGHAPSITAAPGGQQIA
jgi:hypothetical protein